MNAKPNPEKPAIVVFFIIFAIMLIAALMFIFEWYDEELLLWLA